MPRSMLPRSARKFLRREKARIRREHMDAAEVEKKVIALMEAVRERYGRTRWRSPQTEESVV